MGEEGKKLDDIIEKMGALILLTTRIEERIGNQGIQLSDHESRLRELSKNLASSEMDISNLKESQGKVRWAAIWPALAVGLSAGGFVATLILR